MESILYRYPGPKAFTEDQSLLFNGREKEIRYLANLIDLKKTVVLFGKSGTGKSSLLNAGVMPILRKKQHCDARVIRLLFRGDVELHPDDEVNYLVNNVLQHFPLPVNSTHFLQKIKKFRSASLWWHFKQLQVMDNNRNLYLLIFDQFEELGSYQHSMVSKFLKQLNELLNFTLTPDFKAVFEEALEENPELLSKEEMDLLYEPINVKVVVIVKSEKMGLLHAVKNYISDILQNCHELNPLSREQARVAIQKPANVDIPGATPPFTFEPEAIRAIVDYLQEKSDTTFYESPGIQTSLLQMICSQIEQVIVKDDLDKIITREELNEINALTEDYYDSKIKMLVKTFGLDEAKEKLVRKFIEDKLITQQGETLYREQVFEDNFPIEYTPLKDDDSKLLQQLVDAGLLRKEKRISDRGFRYFYEISHEKLLEPILNTRNKLNQQPGKTTGTGKKDEYMVVKGGRQDVAFSMSESSITPDNNLNSTDAYAFIRKANEFTYEGNYSKAIEFFNRAIDLDPLYFHTYFLRGSAYYNNNDFEPAIADFEKTLELNPEYVDSYNELGRCYLQMKHYELARENFQKVIAKNGSAYYAYNNLGLSYVNQGRYEEAVREFDRALEIEPDYGSGHLNKGIALGLQGKYNEAIVEFNILEKLEPGTYSPFYSRGICYYELAVISENKEAAREFYEKSIVELSQSLLLKPDDNQAMYYLAMDYENSGDLQKAYQQYTEIVQAYPAHIEAWYRKGICESALKQDQHALASFTKVVELDPNHTGALFEKGRMYYNLGNDTDSIRAFTEVINRINNYKEAYYNRGLSYYNLNLFAEAIADFSSAIESDPGYLIAYFKRGQARYNIHEYRPAIDDLNVVAKADPFYLKVNAYIGACYTGLQEFETGLYYHLAEFKADPGNLWNLQNLGFAYQRINPPDFNKALEYHLLAHKIEPQDAWNLSNIGYCYQNIDPPDYKKALEYHLKTYELNPEDVWNLSNIGVCYDKMDPPDHEKALEFSLKAFERNKDDSLAELNLGWCMLLTNNLESAKFHLENTLKKNENEIEAYMNLGHVAFLQNDMEGAVKQYRKRFEEAGSIENFRTLFMADYKSLLHLNPDEKKYMEMFDEVVRSS